MMKATMVINLIAFFFLVGCQDQAPLPIEGEYIGRYAGGTETLTIKSDNTYTQTLIIDGNQVYSNAGKWSSPSSGQIQFYNFEWVLPEGASPGEFFNGTVKSNRILQVVTGQLTRGNQAVLLNEDWNYYLTRKKASNE